MVLRTRIFTLALITLFAAGIVVHSAGATSMSLKMALGDTGIADIADCQGCGANTGDEEGSPTCDVVCTVSFAVSLSQVDTFSPYLADVARPQLVEHLSGRTGLPEPYPPRTLI